MHECIYNPKFFHIPALQGPKIQVLNLKLQHGQYLVRQLEQCDQVEGLLSLRIVTSIFLIMSKMTKS